MPTKKQIILASSSTYRRQLCERLKIQFGVVTPDINESPLDNETPNELVLRLAESKAREVSKSNPKAIIIGSDQIATCDGEIIGKPGSHEKAVEQLTKLTGKKIRFLTSLCVLDAEKNTLEVDVVPYTVYFKELNENMIKKYLQREPAYNCVGAFKSESYGIVLCSKLEGEDPTALIGLPLIRLTQMLENIGFEIV